MLTTLLLFLFSVWQLQAALKTVWLNQVLTAREQKRLSNKSPV